MRLCSVLLHRRDLLKNASARDRKRFAFFVRDFPVCFEGLLLIRLGPVQLLIGQEVFDRTTRDVIYYFQQELANKQVLYFNRH